MVDVALSLGRLAVALALVFLNGFFVAAEFAFVKVRATRIDALVDEGRRGATLLAEIEESLDDYLAVTQLGITLASLGLGWVGEPAVAAILEPILGPVLPAGYVHLAAVGIGFGVITFLHVVFGELAPKTMAIQQAERIALFVAAPMKLFYYIFVPGIVVFNGTANFFTQLIGFSPASEGQETHGEDEIMMIVTRSGEQGHLETDEVEMIDAVFELDDTVAREVMTPRPDVVTVPTEMPLDELRSVAASGEYTRYLVLDEDGDDPVVGFIHAKDVLRAIESGDEGADTTARDLAREVILVPETRDIDDVLAEFRERNVHMAAVIDEWGALEGIVTVEDVLEELVGEIRDEFDTAERAPSIETTEDGYAMDGGVAIEDVNEALGAEFESAEFDTVGGLVLSRLGRAPEVGDSVEADGYAMTVDEVDGARVSRVIVREGSGDEEPRGEQAG